MECTELNKEVEKLLWSNEPESALKTALHNVNTESGTINLYSLAMSYVVCSFKDNDKALLDKGHEIYQKIIDEFPNTMHAELSKARLREETGQMEDSIEYYKRAYNICKSSRNAVHIANAYKQLGNIGAAREFYLKAEGIEPGSAKHHLDSLGN